MDSLAYSIGYNLLLSFIFMKQIGPDLASGSPSIWLLCPFDIFPLFLKYFL